MSDHSYVRRQATTTTTPSTPSDRHLLLIEVSDTIKRDEIAAAKYDNVDVIYVSRETFKGVADTMKQFNVKWRSINMLFHGSADLGENSVDMFGIKMSMNPVLMVKDPNVIDFIAFTKDVCKYTDDSLYIYTCAVGLADGFKSLCLQMDVKLASGIFLSTNITGNGAGQDWDVEWGTQTGFLTAGVHTNEIEHAQICLFKEIKLLTFTLALDVEYVYGINLITELTKEQLEGLDVYEVGSLDSRQVESLAIARKLQYVNFKGSKPSVMTSHMSSIGFVDFKGMSIDKLCQYAGLLTWFTDDQISWLDKQPVRMASLQLAASVIQGDEVSKDAWTTALAFANKYQERQTALSKQLMTGAFTSAYAATAAAWAAEAEATAAAVGAEAVEWVVAVVAAESARAAEAAEAAANATTTSAAAKAAAKAAKAAAEAAAEAAAAGGGIRYGQQGQQGKQAAAESTGGIA